jgi:tRNA pseudouridine38-40 synthase
MLRVYGAGFLYKMVRSMVGFLVRVGMGEMEPEAAVSILKSRTRTKEVPSAQAQGLFLWKVDYRTSKSQTSGR